MHNSSLDFESHVGSLSRENWSCYSYWHCIDLLPQFSSLIIYYFSIYCSTWLMVGTSVIFGLRFNMQINQLQRHINSCIFCKNIAYEDYLKWVWVIVWLCRYVHGIIFEILAKLASQEQRKTGSFIIKY